MLHALVLAAVALVILHRPEDLGAEKAIPLRLEGTIVDRLGLFSLRRTDPLPDLLRGCERDANSREAQRIFWFVEKNSEGLSIVSPRYECLRNQIKIREGPL